MKKVFILFLCTVLMATFMFSGYSPAATTDTSTQKKLVIGFHEVAPYAYLENNVPKGYGYEIMKAALEKANIPYELQFLPVKRVSDYVNSGEIDAGLLLSKNTARESVAYFPTAELFTNQYVMYIRKEDANKLKFTKYDDLIGRKVGTTLGFSYIPDFLAFVQQNKLNEDANSDSDNFKKLIAKKIDYFPCDMKTAVYEMKKLGISSKITYIHKIFITKNIYSPFNKVKVAKETFDKFNASLTAYKKTNDFKKLTTKYSK